MRKVNYFLLTSVMLASFNLAHAKEYKKAHWGMAGCGLGSMLFGEKNDKGMQILAATTNVYFYNTFAMTSGTSNCKNGGKDEAMIEQLVYFTNNLDSLSKEAAQGSGDHLAALAQVFGCPSARISELSQSQYGTLFSTDSADQVHQNYLNAIRSDAELSKSCERVG